MRFKHTATTYSPYIVLSYYGDTKQHIGRAWVRTGHNTPCRAVPVLDQRLRAYRANSPHVRGRDSGHIVQFALRRTRHSCPIGIVPVFDQRSLLGERRWLNVITNSPYVISRDGGYSIKIVGSAWADA